MDMVPKAVSEAEAPLDVAYLQGLEGALSEWSSPADEQAFADLSVLSKAFL